MGKQTLLHPVPLSVLRGSLEYCGWEFQSIKQVKHLERANLVAYKVSKLLPPKDAPRMDISALWAAIQRCFEPRIKVARVSWDTQSGIDAWINVKIKQEKVTISEEEAAQRDIPF